ncbi:hypothetical protein MHYP_G00278930 [Metynnis hypsauchen]
MPFSATPARLIPHTQKTRGPGEEEGLVVRDHLSGRGRSQLREPPKTTANSEPSQRPSLLLTSLFHLLFRLSRAALDWHFFRRMVNDRWGIMNSSSELEDGQRGKNQDFRQGFKSYVRFLLALHQ